MAVTTQTLTNKALDKKFFPRQNYFLLNGNKSPGLATIRGASTPRN